MTATTRAGVIYALAAYGWWGFSALYFKQVAHVPAMLVLAHRLVWSVLLLAVLMTFRRQWSEVRAAYSSRRVMSWLLLSTVLIATNWLIFIYAVATHRLMDCSLGYFVNPLFTVLLGMIFLGEKLRPAQWCAAGIAALGLVYLSVARGGLPWIALALPLTFGFYGLIRKRTPVDPLPGLFIETSLFVPLAVGYVAWMHTREHHAHLTTPGAIGLLALAGPVTAIPMLWFVAAAKRLPLVTIGFLQYLNPTLQFLTAVLLFGESFDQDRVIAFSLIWLAVIVFVAESVVHVSRASRALQSRRAESLET